MNTDQEKPLPAIRDLVHHLLYMQGRGMRHASKRMGRSANFLSEALKGGKPRIDLLLHLSRELNHNLLNLYMPLLPDHLQTTPAEAALKDQVAALKAELEKTMQERDKYWAVIAGRGSGN